MSSPKIKPEEMWARQQIGCRDVDYTRWENKRQLVRQMSEITSSCYFTVDVYKKRYDFASRNFSDIFGYKPSVISAIQLQGDVLEDRIHPEDRKRMTDIQLKHSRFIYSLPQEQRNNYQNVWQFRMLNAKNNYVNVISRQQVIETDVNGKAWMIMGMMDISPDQSPLENIGYSSLNIKTGEIVTKAILCDSGTILSARETEILRMIRCGLLSKEIAERLNISIHTVNNHRKNILTKLDANNSIEAITRALQNGWIGK